MAVTLSTLHHVGLIVTDFERSVAFYTKLLGMEPAIRGDVHDHPVFSAQTQTQNGHALVAFFQIANSSLEVIQFLHPQESIEQVSVHRPGSKHVCFGVDDVDATYEAMLQEGYEFLAAPAHFGPGPFRPRAGTARWCGLRLLPRSRRQRHRDSRRPETKVVAGTHRPEQSRKELGEASKNRPQLSLRAVFGRRVSAWDF